MKFGELRKSNLKRTFEVVGFCELLWFALEQVVSFKLGFEVLPPSLILKPVGLPTIKEFEFRWLLNNKDSTFRFWVHLPMLSIQRLAKWNRIRPIYELRCCRTPMMWQLQLSTDMCINSLIFRTWPLDEVDDVLSSLGCTFYWFFRFTWTLSDSFRTAWTTSENEGVTTNRWLI